MKEIGIYVPSYNRSDAIITKNVVPTACYVVRKTQEQKYRDAGIDKIWAVEDELINSWSNVMNYIVANAPEQLVVCMDDDIEKFFYILDQTYEITNPITIVDELTRLANIMDDLDIGFGALMFDFDPKKYHKEFMFAGTLGAVYFFNRNKVVGKFHNEASAVADAEFELQELLHNRIVLLPKYIAVKARYNKGVNTQNRSSATVRDAALWTKLRWGKHFTYNMEKNKTSISVRR